MHVSKITGFHKDDDGHWVAELDCGHQRHMRHIPPFQDRPWVMVQDGRDKKVGHEIACELCRQGIPPG